MRLLLSLFVFLAFSLSSAFAQAPAAPPADAAASDADIDALIRIIENDETRAALLERLQQSADVEPALPEDAPPDLSIARQLAEYTRSVAEGSSAALQTFTQFFAELQRGFTGTRSADLAAFWTVALNVLMVAAGLIVSFLLLRLAVLWLQRRIAKRVEGRRWYARLAGALGATVIDAGSVLVAGTFGYVLALNIIGGANGRMGINQSLLLNAFFVVEMSKVVVRALLAPRFASLRLLPLSDDNAAYWSFWLARIISLVGYVFMFVAPVVAANLSTGIAAGIQVLAMATAVIIGIVIVLQNKDAVKQRLGAISERRGNDSLGRLLMLIGQYWHVVAIAYLLALLLVWFTNPDEALPFMLGATVQSIIAVLVGVVVVGFITRFVSVGLHLPDDIKQRLPLLEARLQAFVPRVLQIVRLFVVAVVLLVIAQAWALFDFAGWIASEGGQQVVGSILSAALIVLICIVLYVVVASWVEYRLNTNSGKTPTAREKTLLSLFKNAFTVALVVFGTMLALAQIGVNIAPLLAGAGVVGLAIGFGAQKLVQDIITGIFIQFENIMNEGDVVEAAGKSGVVEKLTIRSVTIRDMAGTVHLIPFSSVDQVSNMVRGYSFYVAELEVAYDSDLDAVKQAMRDAFDMLMETDFRNVILDNLDLHGLVAITPTSMTLRARIKTLAGQQWGAGRHYTELVLRLFAERGIETPTQRVAYIPGRTGNGRPELPPIEDTQG